MTMLDNSEKLATNLGANKHKHQTCQRDKRVLTSRTLHVLTEELEMSQKQNEKTEPEEHSPYVH